MNEVCHVVKETRLGICSVVADTLLCTSVGEEGVGVCFVKIFRLIFVLCGCGSLSFTFRGCVGGGCFENRLLRKIFGPKVKV
jgi:hypothetical protein